MNVLLFYPSECESSADTDAGVSVRLHGKRRAYVQERHEITAIDVTVKAGIIGGALGKATLLSQSTEEIVFHFQPDLKRPAPPRSNTTLVVGVPRPQTVKKIIQVAVGFGVETLCFVPFEKSIKSYLTSKVWQPESLGLETFESLEQAGDTNAPTIILYKKLQDFFSSYQKKIEDSSSRKIIFDSYGEVVTSSSKNSQPTFLVFGPEAGFVDSERTRFQNFGFTMVSFGERMLRSEHATCAGLALFS